MRSWTDKDLKIAVQNSISFVQVFDKLGLSRRGSYKIIKFYIKKLNIDTSHFLTLEEINKKSRSFLKRRTKQDIFVKDGSYNDCKTAKAIIIREQLLEYKCSECKINEWNGKKITLQLDHINGNRCDNRLSNLRFLCPNCHSLTETFCGKKLRKTSCEKSHHKSNRCLICKKMIHKKSIFCKDCFNKNRITKIEWPENNLLKLMLQTKTVCAVAKELNVSDTAVRKHCKFHGIVY